MAGSVARSGSTATASATRKCIDDAFAREIAHALDGEPDREWLADALGPRRALTKGTHDDWWT